MCTEGNQVAENQDYQAGKDQGRRDFYASYRMDDDTRVSLGCSAEYLAGYDYAQYVASGIDDEFRMAAT